MRCKITLCIQIKEVCTKITFMDKIASIIICFKMQKACAICFHIGSISHERNVAIPSRVETDMDTDTLTLTHTETHTAIE